MRYFYLKLGKGNSLALNWLRGNNPLGRPAAVIFFGHCTVDDIRKGNSGQAKDFYASSLVGARNETVMVVIGQGCAWFLRPAGELIEYKSPDDTENLWKIMPVDEIIPYQSLDRIPPVLAGINANTYLSQGTYREIKTWGNIKAIHCALQLPLPSEHLQEENCNAHRLLECLSSVELETLVAKVFEAAGCFVPAYRGGCVRDVDLFAHNDGDNDIRLDGLSVPAGQSISIQVKGTSLLKQCPDAVNCLIALGVSEMPKCFGEEWLLKQVTSSEEVANWLRRSLNWMPAEFVMKCGL